jgi:Voltage gated chloride channel
MQSCLIPGGRSRWPRDEGPYGQPSQPGEGHAGVGMGISTVSRLSRGKVALGQGFSRCCHRHEGREIFTVRRRQDRRLGDFTAPGRGRLRQAARPLDVVACHRRRHHRPWRAGGTAGTGGRLRRHRPVAHRARHRLPHHRHPRCQDAHLVPVPGIGHFGGVLAPVFMIGGALGAAEGMIFPQVFPGFWAMLGLAAVVGGVMRSPLTGVIFTLELGTSRTDRGRGGPRHLAGGGASLPAHRQHEPDLPPGRLPLRRNRPDQRPGDRSRHRAGRRRHHAARPAPRTRA